ncbi:uncharacterized protein B4U79_14161 [Dinothrombium tinctorium]|uniref:Cyclic nucleotide-binding domain-containing protein n=1 Tax=Dinothrombium tinctorium TaxID=1965070 RepID=A0A443R188_9ACAR|nr:uncharacterized protein B4U79_14161 [Dinothrombium tinctorium]
MIYREDSSSKNHSRDSHHEITVRSRHLLPRSLSWDEISESSNEKLHVSHESTKIRCQSAKTPQRHYEEEKSGIKAKNEVESGRNDAIRCIPILCIEEDGKQVEFDVHNSPNSSYIIQKLRLLIHAFAERAQKIKMKISRPLSAPPSPTSEQSDILPRESTIIYKEDWQTDDKSELSCWQEIIQRIAERKIGVFDPQSYVYIIWLFFVCLAFLFNAYGILLRTVFPYQTNDNLPMLLALDYICDAIYVIDIILFKSRLKYTEEGHLVENPKFTRRHYFKTSMFVFDCVSLLPLDILYIFFGPNIFLRLPRLLKIQTFWEFFNRVDVVAKSPYAMRVIKTLIYMTFLIHLNAGAYYAVSKYEGFDANEWVYNNKGNAYIRCFYFAFRTATSISGKMVKPTNNLEYLFMVNSWLNGVFVFAFLIGQIRDIVSTATQNKQQFRQIMNQTIRHMNNLNLPQDLQKRVRLWLNYTWEQQRMNDGKILEILPVKMKTDIAMNVHYKILSKVQLFQGCERMVLRDLVVKLKPVLFLPNDFICRKGEIGHEMYIINEGIVQVLDDSGSVLATLSEGSVFGEISVLGLPGCSRRMADVRSLGFSNLFMLSKADLWDTLRNYPEAQKILRQKARRAMKERQGEKETSDEIDAESVIKDSERPSTPRLMQAVIQIVSPESKCAKILSRSRSPSIARSSNGMSLTPSVTHNTLSPSSFISSESSEFAGNSGEQITKAKISHSVGSSITDLDVISEIMSNIPKQKVS